MIEIYRNTSRKKLTVQNIPQMVFYCKQELAFQTPVCEAAGTESLITPVQR